MVILGQRDILFSDASYKEVAQLTPCAEQVVIPVSAHQVTVERPDAVNRVIERFLQAQIDPRASVEKRLRKRCRVALPARRWKPGARVPMATGDIASMDEDGFFTIIDRKENMLLRGGQKIFPRQVEEVLFEHPAVALVQVKRLPDEAGVLHLRASVMLHRSMNASVEELLKYCSKRLHPSALPDSITIDRQETTAVV